MEVFQARTEERRVDKYQINEDRRLHIDKCLPKEQWDDLIDMWMKEDHQAMSSHNSQNRENLKLTQSTGKTPYACIREKKRWEHPEGLNPSCFDPIKVTHTRRFYGY